MGTRSRGLGVKAPQLALLLGCCVASSSAFMLRPPLPLSAATTRGAALGMRSFQLRHPQHLRNARLPVAGCGQGRCRAHHQTTRMQRGEGQGEGAGMLHKFSELLTVCTAAASIIIAAMTLLSGGGPAWAGDFAEVSDTRARSELIFTPNREAARGACSDGWAYNWRSTGRASLCLESDGCLWRKFESTDGKKPQQKVAKVDPSDVDR
ncbi:hypothetical protein T484DRAFT_1808403, partial [Baffinella frigidus]